MVPVLCVMFYQKRYIRKCLESLVKQKTNFKYEILIHDRSGAGKNWTSIGLRKAPFYVFKRGKRQAMRLG